MRNHVKNILIAAVVTAIFITILTKLGLAARFCISYGCDGKVLLLLMMLVNIFASTPGMLWLLKKQTPHAIGMSLFAVVEAFWISFALVPILIPINWWLWALTASALLVITYLFAYLLFINWSVRFRYKLIVSIGIALVTAVICDRLIALI